MIDRKPNLATQTGNPIARPGVAPPPAPPSQGGANAYGAARPGFTLIELLVVITIILIVSAVALPTVLPALQHRQVSEAARILQAVLAGARDAAIRDNAPAASGSCPTRRFSGMVAVSRRRCDANPDSTPRSDAAAGL